MTITKKMLTVYGLVIAAVVANACISFWLIKQIRNDIAEIAEVAEPLEEVMLELEINLFEASRSMFNFLHDFNDTHLQKIDDSKGDIVGHLMEFHRLAQTKSMQYIGSEASSLFAKFNVLIDDIVNTGQKQRTFLTTFRKKTYQIDELTDGKIQNAINSSNTPAIKKLEAALEMEINIDEAFAGIESYILKPDTDLINIIQDAQNDFDHFLANYNNSNLSANEKQWSKIIEKDFYDTVGLGREIITLTDQLNSDLKSFDAMLFKIDRIFDEQIQPMLHEKTRMANQNAQHFAKVALTLTVVITVILLSFIGGGVPFMTRGITRRIQNLTKGAEAFGQGDLNSHITDLGKDEIGQLAKSFNLMMDKLNVSRKEMIEAKEEAEHSNRAKSEFLSRMSHKLRTPMNAILGFTQLLDFDPRQPLSDSQKTKVNEIMKAGKHLLELINDVLDLSRIEAGEMTVSLEDFFIKKVIDDTLTLVYPMATQRNIQIIHHASNQPDLQVHADPTQLKQSLLNLLSNALKYNRENGSIIVDCKQTTGGRIRIDITDTGLGISEENQKLLFQPFNRLDADKSVVEGTGIGLNITKQLVELMHGTISVHSVPGKGSRFSVEIPGGKQLTSETEDEVITPVLKANRETGGQKWTVLYVEDNPSNLMLFERILKMRPEFKVLTAPQARLGIDLARAHRPDLILMDITMPKMDGTTAMKKLKNYEETRDIPVIAVSANAMESDIEKALAAGFTAYITKPFDIPRFLMEVDRFLKPENRSMIDSTR